MGDSSNTLHIHCTDHDAVLRAYGTLLRRRGFRLRASRNIPHYRETHDEPVFRRLLIGRPINGWITVIDQRYDEQDLRLLDRIGTEITAALDCAAVSFVLHDGEALYMLHWDSGACKGRWCSWPGWYADGVPAREAVRERWKGDPRALLPLCREGVTVKDLENLMRDYSRDSPGCLVWPEKILADLGGALGIDDGLRTYAGFHAKPTGLHLVVPNGNPIRVDRPPPADPYWDRFVHLHFMRRPET